MAALALALAFGLGNRDLAGEVTRDWYERYRAERDAVEAPPDLFDAAADGAGAVAGASATGGEDDSVLLIQSGLPPLPKDAVVSVSNMDKPPQPERQVAIRTAVMRVRSTMRFRLCDWDERADEPEDSPPSRRPLNP